MGDGLTFLTPPLQQQIEITGPVAAKLFVSSASTDADMFLVLVGTLGASFAMFGRCYPGAAVDIVLRCLFAVLAFAVLFVPDIKMSVSFAVVLVIALAGGIWQHRKIAPPKKYALTPQQNASTGDLAPVLAEAKRDIG